MSRTLANHSDNHTTDAVHPLEVVARAEADGFSDADARNAGFTDLFDYGLQSTRTDANPVADPVKRSDGARVSLGSLALRRGLIFTMPGLSIAALLPSDANGTIGVTVLLLALIAPWALGQAFAYAAYSKQALGPNAENRMISTSVIAACIVATFTWAAIVIGTGNVLLAVAASAQLVYMIAATGAIVRRAERFVLAALVPGTVAGIARIWNGIESPPAPWQVALAGASIVLTVIIALIASRRRTVTTSPSPIRWRSVVTFGLYGLVVALSVVWIPVRFPSVPTLGAILALTLSMGAVEAALVLYRRWGHDWLDRSTSAPAFARSARLGLLWIILGYVLTLVGILAVVGLVELGWNVATDVGDLLPVSFLVVILGVNLLLASMLVAFRALSTVVIQWAIAILVVFVGLLAVPGSSSVMTYVACGLLLPVTAAGAFTRITRPNLHL